MKHFITSLLIATGMFAISGCLAMLIVLFDEIGGFIVLSIAFIAVTFSVFISLK